MSLDSQLLYHRPVDMVGTGSNTSGRTAVCVTSFSNDSGEGLQHALAKQEQKEHDEEESQSPSLRKDGPDGSNVGSKGHPESCKPCAFYCFSLRGCNAAQECTYCHLFHESRMRRRRAEWKRVKQQRQQQQQQQISELSPTTSWGWPRTDEGVEKSCELKETVPSNTAADVLRLCAHLHSRLAQFGADLPGNGAASKIAPCVDLHPGYPLLAATHGAPEVQIGSSPHWRGSVPRSAAMPGSPTRNVQSALELLCPHSSRLVLQPSSFVEATSSAACYPSEVFNSLNLRCDTEVLWQRL